MAMVMVMTMAMAVPIEWGDHDVSRRTGQPFEQVLPRGGVGRCQFPLLRRADPWLDRGGDGSSKHCGNESSGSTAHANLPGIERIGIDRAKRAIR